ATPLQTGMMSSSPSIGSSVTVAPSFPSVDAVASTAVSCSAVAWENQPRSTATRPGASGTIACAEPDITRHASSRSSADDAIGPGQSSDVAIGIIPAAESRPVVGFRPQQPQSEEGIRIEPPVSEPSAIGTTPDATAEPEPPLDPPVIRAGS